MTQATLTTETLEEIRNWAENMFDISKIKKYCVSCAKDFTENEMTKQRLKQFGNYCFKCNSFIVKINLSKYCKIPHKKIPKFRCQNCVKEYNKIMKEFKEYKKEMYNLYGENFNQARFNLFNVKTNEDDE